MRTLLTTANVHLLTCDVLTLTTSESTPPTPPPDIISIATLQYTPTAEDPTAEDFERFKERRLDRERSRVLAFPIYPNPGPMQKKKKPTEHTMPEEGAYAPCSCGSGKKWKFCHKPPAAPTAKTIGFPRFEIQWP